MHITRTHIRPNIPTRPDQSARFNTSEPIDRVDLAGWMAVGSAIIGSTVMAGSALADMTSPLPILAGMALTAGGTLVASSGALRAGQLDGPSSAALSAAGAGIFMCAGAAILHSAGY